ncbi:MAG: polyhydroxyalkanoate synthesis regulator DNA-binding domain-containing protein [Myxococcota bacterium]
MTVEEPAPKPPESPAEEAEKKAARMIKRYSNRKLYDTESSKYVTLEEIAHMIKAGEEIVIIDNKTKDDLTAVTLTQIIYEEEKRKSRMPLDMLKKLITSSGDAFQDFLEKSVKQPVVDIQTKAQHSVSDLRQSALHLREAATSKVTELTESARRVFQRSEADLEKKVDEALRGYEESFEDLKKRIEGQAQKTEQDGARMVGHLVDRLEGRVGELSAMLAELKKKVEAEAKREESKDDEPSAG